MSAKLFCHLFLDDSHRKTQAFTKGGGGEVPSIPSRNPQTHATYLERQLKKAWEETESEHLARHVTRRGTYIEFKGEAGFDLATKSLDNTTRTNKKSGGLRNKMRLLNVREEVTTVLNPQTGRPEKTVTKYATVFVSHEQRKAFFAKLQEYGNPLNQRHSGKQNHEKLMAGIADIERADRVRCFWTDDLHLIPVQEEWCEIWLTDYGDTEEAKARFEDYLVWKNIESKPEWIRFPERLVKGIWVDKRLLEEILIEYDDVAEFRLMKEVETATIWCNRSKSEQAAAIQDLSNRIYVDQDAENVSVCIFDTGVNYSHPLLSPILQASDCHAIRPDWNTTDHHHHGTLMAGLAAYGDLSQCLDSQGTVYLHHVLESVKLLSPFGPIAKELWGDYTKQGVSLAEIHAPGRTRIVCLAVTASDTRDHGRPTSWSAAVDQVTSGAEDNLRRLVIISTGNANQFKPYPDTQKSDSVHDPAQSWNALTVGAYTELARITNPDDAKYQPIASAGELSPFSTTSLQWDSKWPIKPEIVMEGGNAILTSDDARECDDLSLTSTWWKFATDGHLAACNMTSAASAQAAWFAAQIQSQYPNIWPETLRALMVHSADWTDELRHQFLNNPQHPKKGEYVTLLRAAGYGVPHLERSLGNLSSSLTLISEAELLPFKHEGSRTKVNEMHMYDLPWPEEELRQIPDTANVKMRVTLSYFIEPGPGEIGWMHRYRYPSFGLRFDVKSPSESPKEFLKRINKAAREQEEGHPGTGSASGYWQIGSNIRDRGSIHSDIWEGTAAELADSGHIAVFPIGGWWKERHHLGRWDRKARYSLIVSILTDGTEVDIYTPVAIRLGVSVPVLVEIEI